jgi:DNA-binding transcriptional regulator YdaS (Cro superfamily)
LPSSAEFQYNGNIVVNTLATPMPELARLDPLPVSRRKIDCKDPHLRRALAICNDSRRQLSMIGGVSYAMACQWIIGHRRVGPQSAIRIERATKGQVTAHQLRPDLFDKPPRASRPAKAK